MTTKATEIKDDPFATTIDPSTNESEPSDTTSGVPETSVPSVDSELTEGEIGHVLMSERITVGRDEYNVNVFVTITERDATRVGNYVQIPYPNSNNELFAVTDKLRYERYADPDEKCNQPDLVEYFP